MTHDAAIEVGPHEASRDFRALRQYLQNLSSRNSFALLLAEHDFADIFFPVLAYWKGKLQKPFLDNYYRLPVVIPQRPCPDGQLQQNAGMHDYLPFGRILTAASLPGLKKQATYHVQRLHCGSRSGDTRYSAHPRDLAILTFNRHQQSAAPSIDSSLGPAICQVYSHWADHCVRLSGPAEGEAPSEVNPDQTLTPHEILDRLASRYADEDHGPPFYPILNAHIKAALETPLDRHVVNLLSWHCNLLHMETSKERHLREMIGRSRNGTISYRDDLRYDDKGNERREYREDFDDGTKVTVNATIDHVVPLGRREDSDGAWIIYARHNMPRDLGKTTEPPPAQERDPYWDAADVLDDVWHNKQPEGALMTTYWAARKKKGRRFDLLSLGMKADSKAMQDAVPEAAYHSADDIVYAGDVTVRFKRLGIRDVTSESARQRCRPPAEAAHRLLNRDPVDAFLSIFVEMVEQHVWHPHGRRGLFAPETTPDYHNVTNGAGKVNPEWIRAFEERPDLRTQLGDVVRRMSIVLDLGQVHCHECSSTSANPCWCLNVLKAMCHGHLHPALLELALTRRVCDSTSLLGVVASPKNSRPKGTPPRESNIEEARAVVEALRGIKYLLSNNFEKLGYECDREAVVVRLRSSNEMLRGVAGMLFHDEDGRSFVPEPDRTGNEHARAFKAIGRFKPHVAVEKKLGARDEWEHAIVLRFRVGHQTY